MLEMDWIQAYQRALNSLILPEDLTTNQIHRLAQRGMLVELLADASPTAVEIVQQTVISAALPQVKQDALNGLIGLAQQDHSQAILSLYHLALDHQHSGAIAAITAQRFQPGDAALAAAFAFLYLTFDEYTHLDSEYHRLGEYLFRSPVSIQQLATVLNSGCSEKLRLANLFNALLDLQPQAAAWLLAEFPRFTPPEKRLIFARLVDLAGQESTLARDTLCRLAILHDHVDARQVSLQKGYLPTDTSTQAAFLFLTEQWQAYETLDYSYQWLTAAYDCGDANLKQKILSRSRSSGKIDWLQNITRARMAVNLSDLTARDWQAILGGVFASQTCDPLVPLLQHAPAYWCAQILQRLFEIPSAAAPDDDLSALIDAARPCFGQLPEIVPAGYLQSPARGISALTLAPDGQELAIGGGDAALHFWNLSLRFWQPELISPVANTRAIAYSPDGEFFATACGDNRIRIYRSSSRTLLKTLSGHTAQIKSLVFQPDGRVLFSAGLDGSICAWRFPSGALVFPPITTNAELFGLALTGKDNLLVSGGASRVCQIHNSSSGALIHSIPGFEDTILTLAANTAQWVAISTRDRRLHLLNPSSGKPVLPALAVPDGITQLLFHPAGYWLYSLDLSGRIIVWQAAILEKAFELCRHTQPGSGLALTPDGHTLISAGADGKIVIWDLRVVNRTFLAEWQDAPAEIALLEAMEKSSDFPPINQRWLAFLLALWRWRARFDILIGELPVLAVGEYDILL